MTPHKFSMKLEMALRCLDEGTGLDDPVASDPSLKSVQMDADRKGTNQNGMAKDKASKQAEEQRKQQDLEKQKQQGTQLSGRMADADKQIAQLQARIQGGQAKQADIGKLNQLLTAKKAVQDQFMKVYGVNPSS